MQDYLGSADRVGERRRMGNLSPTSWQGGLTRRSSSKCQVHQGRVEQESQNDLDPWDQPPWGNILECGSWRHALRTGGKAQEEPSTKHLRRSGWVGQETLGPERKQNKFPSWEEWLNKLLNTAIKYYVSITKCWLERL